MRTIKELEQAALTLRARLLEEGKDPQEAVFHVTPYEQLLILAQPPFDYAFTNAERDRFCGMTLRIV